MDRRRFLKAAGLITGAMYVDLPTFAQKVSEMGAPRLCIGILSDIHVRNEETCKTFRHALEYFREREVDGVLIAGDMADDGLERQMKVIADTWFSVFPKDKLPNGKHVERLFVYGNHDMEAHTYHDYRNMGISDEEALKDAIGPRHKQLWKKYYKETYQPVYMKTVKGYHFIGAHWEDWSKTKDAPAFIEQHKTELSGPKPFFYFQHAHPRNTTYGEWAWGQDNGDVTKALSQFPNAIAFSGHSHLPLDNEYSLWQEEFTSLNTSSLSYLCPLGGRENSYVDGGADVPSQMKRANHRDKKQGMVMTVYDNSITFERREFVYDEPVGDNWIIPLPMKGAQMSFENRRKKAVAPEFAKGDKVSIREIAEGEDRYGVKQPQVEVKFPSVLKKRTGVRAVDYEIQVEQQYVDTLTVVGTKRVYSPGAHLGENHDEQDVVCLFGKSELPSTHKYRFAVRPCESFGKKGQPIYSEWMGTSVK